MKWFNLFTLLFLIAVQSYSQDDKYLLSSLTSKEGLANNRVNSIVQDSRGFMWFGTTEGLSRFDGRNFKNYYEGNTPNSLRGNHIVDMVEFKPTQLAFVVANKWLTILNTATNTFSYPKEFQNKKISTLKKGLFANFFVSSADDTCYELNSDLSIKRTLIPPFAKKLWYTSIEQLDSSLIFLGRPGEYLLYNSKTNQYRSFLTKVRTSGEPLIFRYFDAASRNLYFSNFTEGLICFDLSGNLLKQWRPSSLAGQVKPHQITFVSKKNNNELWICSADVGLSVLNLETGELGIASQAITNQQSISIGDVFQNYIDKDNSVWLATTNGVQKLRKNIRFIRSWSRDFTFKNTNATLSGTALGSDGNIYQPLFGQTYCYVINYSSEKAIKLDTNALPHLWAAENFKDEVVFHGFGTTITRYNLNTKQYTHSSLLHSYFPKSEIVTLAYQQKNGTEWYSGNQNGGLLRVESNNTKHLYKKEHQNLGNGYYSYAAEDREGDLWFGVNKSNLLLHWNHATDSFRNILFDTVKGFTRAGFGGIFDVKYDGANNSLWITFESSGIVKYDLNTRVARQYTMADGLPTNYIYALGVDAKNRVWAGSHEGLSCLQPSENRFVNFTVGDGLTDDFFDDRCILFDPLNNKIWAGTNNTMMSFDPDSLLNSKQKKTAVFIDDIHINGALLLASKDGIETLQPEQTNLLFSFTAPDVYGSADIEYSYKLVGADKDWFYSGSINTASYNNLSPGNYSFLVRAKHKGSNFWTETANPFSFHIQTPWYASWWFKLITLTAVLLIILYISRLYYLRKFEKQQAVEKERTRIATDMHDDFGASLSRIKFISQKILYNGEEQNEPLKNDLSKISLYSDEMSQKLNQIVWALNQRYDTLGDLVSYCREYASDAFIENNIKFHFEEEIDPEKALQGEVRRNIFLTLKESVNNVIKHAEATEVHISFRYSNEHILLTIKDNGKGIDMATIRPFANGLENMKKRIQDIRGSLHFENNMGTLIKVTVPVG